nr:MAG: hypothetical protein [Bacteriophage sp.]
MGMIKELISKIFGRQEEELILDDRIEFRLNSNEKLLIKKYCKLKNTDLSKFFRNIAMKEINEFLNMNQ